MSQDKNPTVIIDTREQQPWEFANSVRRALRTGDYSITGLEDVVAIERKSLDDYVGSVIHDWARFRRELRRLAAMEGSCVIIEATVENVLDHKHHSDVSPLSIIGRAHAILCDYGVPTFFVGPRPVAKLVAERLLMLWHKKLNKESDE